MESPVTEEIMLELTDELYDIIFLAKARILEEKFNQLPPKITKHQDTMNTLDGIKLVGEPWYTKQGIVSVFEKAVVYGSPRDAASYWINKKGRKKAFGEFLGWIITEIAVPQTLGSITRVNFEFTVKEAHIEARKKLRKTLRERGIKRHYYESHLKGNTLLDFATGRAEKNIAKKKIPIGERVKERVKRMKERDRRRITA